MSEKELQRYGVHIDMNNKLVSIQKQNGGDLVLYDDVAKLKEQVSSLEAQVQLAEHHLKIAVEGLKEVQAEDPAGNRGIRYIADEALAKIRNNNISEEDE